MAEGIKKQFCILSNMKKVLVTGSLGYIGSVLTGYLEERGYSCVGYDTGFFRDCVLYAPPETETILGDARDMKEEHLDGVDAVVHLAGISNDPFGKLDVSRIYDPTREYALNIAKMCQEKGIKFVYASSCSAYGLGEAELLTESSPAYPQTPYSLNKLQVEEDLRAISGKDFSPVALRFATVFGSSPRPRFDVVVNMFVGMAVTARKIILNSDGLAWRPNVHILDVCQAIERAIEHNSVEGGLMVLNVGDEGNNLRVIEIAKIVQDAVPGCKIEFLEKNLALDKEGLIRDRKVKGGVDTRTYRCLLKDQNRISGFQYAWPVKRGLRDGGPARKLFLAKTSKQRFLSPSKIESLRKQISLGRSSWLKDRPEIPKHQGFDFGDAMPQKLFHSLFLSSEVRGVFDSFLVAPTWRILVWSRGCKYPHFFVAIA